MRASAVFMGCHELSSAQRIPSRRRDFRAESLKAVNSLPKECFLALRTTPVRARSVRLNGAEAAHAVDLDNRVGRLESVLVRDLGQQLLKPPRLHLVHMAARGTEQELAFVRVVGVVARQVGLRGLQAVDEAGSHEEVQVAVDGQRRDLAFLALLQQRDEFVGGKRATAVQHFRVGRQSGGRQPLAPFRAAPFGERSPFRREFC